MTTPRATRSHPHTEDEAVPSNEPMRSTLPSLDEELTPIPSRSPSPTPPPLSVQEQFLQLFKTLADNQTKLQEVIATQQGRGYTRSPEAHSGVSSRDPNVQDPDTFTGVRDALNGFLTQVQLVFDLQPRRFPEDRIKISYVIAKFRGTPLNAIRPYLALPEDDKPDWLITYSKFVEYLRRSYGDPDEKGTAERKIQTLSQKGSASAYFADFQQYSAVLGWDDAPLVSMAIRGLKDELRDQLVLIGDRPKTLSELIDVVVRLDNRLWERKQEKRGGDGRTTSDNSRPLVARSAVQTSTTTTYQNRTTDRPTSGSHASTPMPTVTRSTSSQPSTQNPGMPRRLSDEEKQRRRDKGLCLFCGQAGHIATNCPAAGRAPISSPNLSSPRSTGTKTSSYEQSKVSAPQM